MNFFGVKARRQRGIGEIDRFRFLAYEQNPRHFHFSSRRIILIRRSSVHKLSGSMPLCLARKIYAGRRCDALFAIAPYEPELPAADFPAHKVDYRSIGLTRRFSRSRPARGGKQEATPAREWMTMLALVEGHPNIDAVVFYLLAS